jgi:hypothetical protein
MPIAGNRRVFGGGTGARGVKFTPDANTVLWLPGQDDAYSTTIRDRSGQNNNGAITGATWERLPSGLWINNFDGTDDYINCGNGANLNFAGGSFTVEMWANPAAYDSRRFPFGKWDSNKGWYLDYLSATEMRFLIIDSVGQAVNDAYIPAVSVAGKMHHIACVYDASTHTATAYLDAVAGTPRTNALLGNADTAYDLYVGSVSGTTGTIQWKGSITLVRIYKRALTILEIANDRSQERHLFGV